MLCQLLTSVAFMALCEIKLGHPKVARLVLSSTVKSVPAGRVMAIHNRLESRDASSRGRPGYTAKQSIHLLSVVFACSFLQSGRAHYFASTGCYTTAVPPYGDTTKSYCFTRTVVFRWVCFCKYTFS